MNIEKTIQKGIHIYKFKGRIDFHPFDLLNESVYKDAVNSHAKSVILDFTDLNYISSLGIRFIYDIKSELNKLNIQMAITGASDSIVQVFRLLGLYETFSIYPSFEEASNDLTRKT